MNTQHGIVNTSGLMSPLPKAKKPARWRAIFRATAVAAVLAIAMGLAGVADAQVLSDFTVIRGDDQKKVGDGAPIWTTTFSTSGRRANSPAFLILNVKGLTHALTPAEVRVNNRMVGYIYPHGGGFLALGGAGVGMPVHEWWCTQLIPVPGDALNSGNNELQIRGVSFRDAVYGNIYDDFWVKNVICFFHQEAS
jgi:hypothetical protein